MFYSNVERRSRNSLALIHFGGQEIFVDMSLGPLENQFAMRTGWLPFDYQTIAHK